MTNPNWALVTDWKYRHGPAIACKLLHPDAKLPVPGSSGAAGFDLHAVGEAQWLTPARQIMVPTGIALQIPPGYVGMICSRSGLAAKHGIAVIGGIIDSDYRGEIKVLLVMHGNTGAQQIISGDRIAQILFLPLAGFPVVQADELDGSTRGEGGFGSTGV